MYTDNICPGRLQQPINVISVKLEEFPTWEKEARVSVQNSEHENLSSSTEMQGEAEILNCVTASKHDATNVFFFSVFLNTSNW